LPVSIAAAKSWNELLAEFELHARKNPGSEFDEAIDRLESGESPDEIEKNMPDLGMNDGF
jgi:hypothetical protein